MEFEPKFEGPGLTFLDQGISKLKLGSNSCRWVLLSGNCQMQRIYYTEENGFILYLKSFLYFFTCNI